MNDLLSLACSAVLPAESLPSLGHLRAWPELRGLVLGMRLWLFWPEGERELALSLLAIDGAVLLSRRDGRWYQAGHHLPTFDVPSEVETRHLSSLLTPIRIEPLEPGPRVWRPLPLRLLPSDEPRPCVLLRTTLDELARWAEQATSHQIESLTAAQDDGCVLLRGQRLPALTGQRFWGRRVLVPFGMRLEPKLPEEALASALRLAVDEVGLVTEQGLEVVPLASFGALCRTGMRLALASRVRP
jgi:hypothetical protein